ncbi:MAG: rhomboid family intramembrane serine protease [Armatimonadetes bacterium]|nr:rhomboid family intramembrane serine protease [Armatimonadota bacterium]
MPLIPYRAKNAPERFPAVTVAFAALLILAYLISANLQPGLPVAGTRFLSLRPDALTAFAPSWEGIFRAPWRLLSGLFLHADLLHLLGNLVMLSVFAPAVEGRLGAARFAALYLVAGALSNAFQCLVAGVLSPEQFVVGASGAIMGLAGAYLYCFPFAQIMVAVTFLWRWDVNHPNPFARYRPVIFDVAAKWVVVFYFVSDLAAALWSGGYSAVANFAHIAGLLTGLGTVALWKTKRDGRRVSDARKSQAEGANLSALSEAELTALLSREPGNEKIIVALVTRLCEGSAPGWESRLADALSRHGAVIADALPPDTLAPPMLQAFADTRLPPAPVFRVAARLQKLGSPAGLRLSAQMYRALYKQEKTTPDAEMALLKYAQVSEELVHKNLSDNANEPIVNYQTFLRRFPASAHVFAAREALHRLGASVPDDF